MLEGSRVQGVEDSRGKADAEKLRSSEVKTIERFIFLIFSISQPLDF